MSKQYDLIIIGAGLAGLYAGYKIRKMNPKLNFIIIDKENKKCFGENHTCEKFYGINISRGDEIIRKERDKLTINILKKLDIKSTEYENEIRYSPYVENPVNIKNTLKKIKGNNKTFKSASISSIGKKEYNDLLQTIGNNDFENGDVNDILKNYPFEDYQNGGIFLKVRFDKLIKAFITEIGSKYFLAETNIIKIKKNIYGYEIRTNKDSFHAKKIILDLPLNKLPDILESFKLENINFVPNVKLYAKFSSDSVKILKHHIKSKYIVSSQLKSISVIDEKNGVYKIADINGDDAKKIIKHGENNEENKKYFEKLVEQSLGMSENLLKIRDIKMYYNKFGSAYFKPTNNKSLRKNQMPFSNCIILNNLFSSKRNTIEGTFESVENVLNKDWINF